MTRIARCAALVLASIAGMACSSCKSSGASGAPSPPPGVTLGSLAVTSKSFPSNGPIPVDYTCDGADRSPQLTWSAPPDGTQSFAIVADDPDAPGGTFTHWIAYDIKSDVLALPEAVDPATLGASVGTNDFKRPGYSGPCPPKMEIHHYYFRVFALSGPLQVAPGASRDAVNAAMSGRVLAEGALLGTFSH
jgi:Raf kinase inhibitor-like YbhB/YbcL family protein